MGGLALALSQSFNSVQDNSMEAASWCGYTATLHLVYRGKLRWNA